MVCRCDLDDFKNVNDSLGHHVGDALLVQTGRRLEAALRPGDMAARLGVDEFGILLRGIGEPAVAAAVAERLIGLFEDPFEVAGYTVRSNPSVGISFGGVGDARAELLRTADLAMYRAKYAGKGRYELFDTETAISAGPPESGPSRILDPRPVLVGQHLG